ncbi:N-acyl amino acid synthase FeeM domain-containing protein [Stieleria maiorica]|nr:hypothetical protein [Stieleria maiorica]
MTVCQSTDDRSEAFSLVHRMYLRTGLTGDNVQGMRVIPHHLLDTTDVMVSRRDGVVDFTVTLVRDGELGLPAESLFPAEIDSMRSCGVKLAEVSCMASQCDRLTQRERLDMLVKMMSLTVRVARRRGVDRLLLAVHPRHAKAYQKMFGCIPCTDVKRYDAVEGNPAVLCLHDFARLDRERYLFYDRIYGTEHEPWKLDGPRMTSAEKEYFKKRVLKSVDSFVPMAA